MKEFGVAVQLSDSPRTRLKKTIFSQPKDDFLGLPTNLSFHNLCTGKIQPPVASKQLLGLGLKYCPRTQTPRQQIKVAIEEL